MKSRLGCVPYLNARPLFAPLLMSGSTDMTLMFDVPRRLAGSLAGGLLAGALGPALHVVTGDYEILPSYGVVSRGPVASVHLYSHKDPKDWSTISLDPASVSSAGLVDVLCRDHFGVEVQQLKAPRDDCDAYFLIGDEDLQHQPAEDVEAWDLGEQWHQLTGLPFLYAAWIVRPSLPQPVRDLLNNSCYALSHPELRASIEDESQRLNLSVARLTSYLDENIHHKLDEDVFAGFQEYLDRLNAIRGLPTTTFRVAER